MSTERWTVVLDVERDEDAGTPSAADVRERIEEEPGVTVYEMHFEDMLTRDVEPRRYADQDEARSMFGQDL